MTISDIVIQNYANGGSFGLNLSSTPVADPVSTTPAIVGDLAPIDQNIIATGVQLGYDTLGNVKTDPSAPDPGRADWLYGSSGNDVIEGRAGGDILAGNGGDDRIYADTQIDTVSAIVQGNTAANVNAQGNWLSGEAANNEFIVHHRECGRRVA